MIRLALLASLAVACGRSQGVADEDLGGLVISPKQKPVPIDLGEAAKDPAELGRALAMPLHEIAAAIGPHTVAISTSTVTTEGGNQVEALDDHTTLELGDKGTFHGVYTNSADYGREVIWNGATLYLRPRYQRWHARAPETIDEPEQLRDGFTDAIAATWDLVAPGAELSDGGTATVAGRAGRKIVVKLSPSPRDNAPEPLVQRKWREKRTIDALSGEVVLDADKGVPLQIRLTSTVGFQRDGRTFAMKLTLQSDVSAIGQPASIVAPAATDVVETPERQKEVDDRDFLLQGIAPPLKKSGDDKKGKP